MFFPLTMIAISLSVLSVSVRISFRAKWDGRFKYRGNFRVELSGVVTLIFRFLICLLPYQFLSYLPYMCVCVLERVCVCYLVPAWLFDRVSLLLSMCIAFELQRSKIDSDSKGL